MPLSLTLLSACVLAAATPFPSAVVLQSDSPNHQFDVLAIDKDDGIYFQVERKDGSPKSEEMRSDFGMLRGLSTVSTNTLVAWRSDSQALVIASDHDRHHVDFLILTETPSAFKALPFDWEHLDRFAHLQPLGFGYASFGRWLSTGHLEVVLTETDGMRVYRESKFEISLDDGKPTPVSWKVVKPEQKIINQ